MGREWNLQQQPVHPGKTVLESRRGTTGSQNNPWFAIERGAANNEENGDVWFGALGWSGSWQITVEQDTMQQVRVTGGPNAFDFSYLLANGKQLQAPYFYGGYSLMMVSAGPQGCCIDSRCLLFCPMPRIPPPQAHPL